VIEEPCVPFVSDCHVRAAVELIDHVWDPVVLTALRLGPTRRSDLLRRIAGVSDKVLTQSLQRLSSRGLIARASDDSRRDTAVYELTGLGASFATGPLVHLAEWAAQNQTQLSAASTVDA
jgi:DNA-binding HxlR family transcriptional regulator